MGKGAEQTLGRQDCVLLQPLRNHCFVVSTHIYTIDECVEALRNKGGVNVAERHHRRKVPQG